MISEREPAVNLKRLNKVNCWLKNIVPTRCYLCLGANDSKQPICHACVKDLPIKRNFCLLCCNPLLKTDICGKCLCSPSKYFNRILTPFSYEYPLNKLIAKIKFQDDLTAAKLLGQLTAVWLKQQLGQEPLPELILPVPLHKTRLRERGYNQSLVLAKSISKALDIPVAHEGCKRRIKTQAQSDLSAKERIKNVKNAFSCHLNLRGKHVAIFDDVITTGATSTSLAKSLKQAGAERIELWALAKHK